MLTFMMEWGIQVKTTLMAIYKYLHLCWNGGDKVKQRLWQQVFKLMLEWGRQVKTTLMATTKFYIFFFFAMGKTSWNNAYANKYLN